ncbi:hypothetical protein BHM03_00062292, partial [Ensete ventricosum]
PRGHPPPSSRTSSASFALKVTLSSSVQIYLFLLSNDSLSSTLKLETSNLPIAPAIATSPPSKSIAVRSSPLLTTQWSP